MILIVFIMTLLVGGIFLAHIFDSQKIEWNSNRRITNKLAKAQFQNQELIKKNKALEERNLALELGLAFPSLDDEQTNSKAVIDKITRVYGQSDSR